MRVQWKRIKRFLLVYMLYIISIVITLIVGYFLNKQNSLIKVNFIIDDEVKSEETSVGNNRDVYNYFLDYSPSMKGFFSADIQSDMHIIAEAFEEINRDNENNRFFSVCRYY